MTVCMGVPTLSGIITWLWTHVTIVWMFPPRLASSPGSGGPCDHLHGHSHPVWHHRLALEAHVTICMGIPTLSGIITWLWRPV